MIKQIFLSIVLLSIVLFISNVSAELNIYTKENGETITSADFERFFNLSNAQRSLQVFRQVNEPLLKIMNEIHSSVDKAQKYDSIQKHFSREGMLNAEYLTLALPNSTNAIEGTLLRQNYELMLACKDLAALQHKHGEIEQEELDKAQQNLESAEKMLQKFWDEFSIND